VFPDRVAGGRAGVTPKLLTRLPDHHRAWPLCPREKNSSVGVTPFHAVAQSVTESEPLGIRIAIAESFAVRQPSAAGT